MPELITDARAIQRLCVQKQVVEAQLAKAMYSQFNSGLALQKVQNACKCMIDSMASGNRQAVVDALEEESRLRVYRGKISTGQRLNFLSTANPAVFDATDCSDIIRLFGVWVERGGLNDTLRTKETDAWGRVQQSGTMLKDAYRPGVQTGAGNWKQEVQAVWADGKKQFEGTTAVRDRGPGRPIEGHIAPYMRNPNVFSGMGGEPAKPEKGKRARGESNVLKLDRLFGLIVGADISGTTTDTVFALEYAYNMQQVPDPNMQLSSAYYLLPVATIVHNNHHALLEVALGLSLGGVNDYDIGFYTTLLPKYSSLPPELEGVASILRSSEFRVDNHHFLLYYSGGHPDGCLLFSRAEAIHYRARGFFRAVRLLNRAPSLQQYPSLETVRGLCREFSIPMP